MTLYSIGTVTFLIACVCAVAFVILLQWQPRSRPIRGMLLIGLGACAVLAVLALAVSLYSIVPFVDVPQVRVPVMQSRYKLILLGLALLVGLFFLFARGFSPKLAASMCGYTMLVLLGVAPDPTQGSDPWAAVLLIIAIAFRLLFIR